MCGSQQSGSASPHVARARARAIIVSFLGTRGPWRSHSHRGCARLWCCSYSLRFSPRRDKPIEIAGLPQSHLCLAGAGAPHNVNLPGPSGQHKFTYVRSPQTSRNEVPQVPLFGDLLRRECARTYIRALPSSLGRGAAGSKQTGDGGPQPEAQARPPGQA